MGLRWDRRRHSPRARCREQGSRREYCANAEGYCFHYPVHLNPHIRFRRSALPSQCVSFGCDRNPFRVESSRVQPRAAYAGARDRIAVLEQANIAGAPGQGFQAVLAALGGREPRQHDECEQAGRHGGPIDSGPLFHGVLAGVLNQDHKEEDRVEHRVEDREEIEAARLTGVADRQDGQHRGERQ